MSNHFARPSRKGLITAVCAALFAIFLLPSTTHALTLPTVFGVNPAYGPSSGGTAISVTGAGFTGTTSVTFGGIPAAGFSIINDNQLTVVTPAHAVGTYHIAVANSSWISVPTSADLFTFTGSPAVSGVFPGGGPVSGGTYVTLTGSGFTGATVVTFGGVPGSGLNVVNDGQLTVFSPSHASGSVFIVVWVGGFPGPATYAGTFVYGGGLAVTGISPASGPSAGGTAVSVTGTGFLGAVAVTFGGVSSTTFFVQSDNQLLAVAPAHSPGAVDILVWSSTASSTPTTADVFTYSGAITVTGISPADGPASGGTTVTLSGTGFLNATSVSFGGTSGTGMTILSDTQLRVTTPPHTAGAVHVLASAGSYVSSATASDTFTFTAVATTDPPSRFAGKVVINGQAAPAGTVIQARVGSTLCGSSTTFASSGESRYVVDVAILGAGHPGCGSDGATVTFTVGGAEANETGTWHNYQLNVVDLSVGATPTVPRTATPVPSEAPRPPSTGSFGGDSSGTSSRSWLLLVLLGLAAMATGAGALAGTRLRPAATTALVSMPPVQVQPSPDGLAVKSVGPRGASSASTLLAIGAIGAAAVVAGTLFARKRR